MIDWNNAKIKYITTPITKSELADLLGCSHRTVMRRESPSCRRSRRAFSSTRCSGERGTHPLSQPFG